MPRIGFTIEDKDTDDARPTMAVWLEGNGTGVQIFDCDSPFAITFDKRTPWNGLGMGLAPDGTRPLQNAMHYESGSVVGKSARILLKFSDTSAREGEEPDVLPYGYKFSVSIEGVEKSWDPRVIPD